MKKVFYISVLLLFSLNVAYSQYSIGVKHSGGGLLPLYNDGNYFVNHCMHDASNTINLVLDLVLLDNTGTEIQTNEFFSITPYVNAEGEEQMQDTVLDDDEYSINNNNNTLSFDLQSYPNCLPNISIPFGSNRSTFQIDITHNGIPVPSKRLTIILSTIRGFTSVLNDYPNLGVGCYNNNPYFYKSRITARYTNNLNQPDQLYNSEDIIVKDLNGVVVGTNLISGNKYSFAPPSGYDGCQPSFTGIYTITFSFNTPEPGINYILENNLKNRVLGSDPSFYSSYNTASVLRICEDTTDNITLDFINIELHNNVSSNPVFEIKFNNTILIYSSNYTPSTNIATLGNISLPKKSGTLKIKLIEYNNENLFEDCDSRSINLYIRSKSFLVTNKVANYQIREEFPPSASYPLGTLSTLEIQNRLESLFGLYNNNPDYTLTLYNEPDINEMTIINDDLLTDWIDDVLYPDQGVQCSNQKTLYFKIVSTCNSEVLPNYDPDTDSEFSKFTINLFDMPPLDQENNEFLYLCNGTNNFTLDDVQNALILRNTATVHSVVFYDSIGSTDKLSKVDERNFVDSNGNSTNVFYVANIGYLGSREFCGDYPEDDGSPLETESTRRIMVTVYNDCCPEPDNLTITETDTTAYLQWDNLDTPPKPIGGWKVHYFFGDSQTYPLDATGMPIDPLEEFITFTPEKLIENLVPGNAYTFFVKSLCADDKESDWVNIGITTLCSGCNTFTPVPGKEYVISAWVKEDWEKTWEVSLAGPNPNTNVGHIKTMLNSLTTLYENNVNSNNAICPNGTVVNGLSILRGLIGNDNNIFHQNLLDEALNNYNLDFLNTDREPAIYNFRYNTDINKFQFQFVEPEYNWTENLLINPGAETNLDTTVWQGDTRYDSSTNPPPHSGLANFQVSLAYQIIEVTDPMYFINNGDGKVIFEGFYSSDHNQHDTPQVWLRFLDENGANLGESSKISRIPTTPYTYWKHFTTTDINIPINTKNIKVFLSGTLHANSGEDDLYFDDLSFRVRKYTNSDKIQTYDVDCYENGEYNFAQLPGNIDVNGVLRHGVEDAENHYPDLKPFFNLKYNCNNHVEESKYNYGKDTFRLVETPDTSTPEQKFEYNNSKIELVFLNNQNQSVIPNIPFVPTGDIIDGWQRIQGTFKIPDDTVKIKIDLVNNLTARDNYFDDVRIFPKDGNMKSFVYDPITQKLMAELDENNYATFYEYDNEGGLIRVKKETEKGVFTIQETRSGNAKK